MKYDVSFQERAKLGMAQISTQPSVTLEQAKSQALWIKQTSVSKKKKRRLRQYIENQGLWIKNIDLNKYVSEGAEQKVYLKDSRTVIKLNDSIYYLSWVDYFVNLLLNNYFFPDTAYKLSGFYETNNTVYAVVQQQFIPTSFIK
jgi:hypothetical protein